MNPNHFSLKCHRQLKLTQLDNIFYAFLIIQCKFNFNSKTQQKNHVILFPFFSCPSIQVKMGKQIKIDME